MGGTLGTSGDQAGWDDGDRRPAPSPVHDRLREDILSLSLPPGSDLDEKSLAARYGVSRTPIREAIIRLSSSGLVEFGATRGARVTPLILPDVARYLEGLDLMQRALAHVGAQRRLANDCKKLAASLARFRALAGSFDPLDYRAVTQTADAEAAALLALGECAHNAYLREAYDKLLVQGRRMLRLPFAYTPRGLEPAEDFAACRADALGSAAEAIDGGDAAAAEEGMRRFHAALVTRLSAYMTENLTADIAVWPAEDTEPGKTGGEP